MSRDVAALAVVRILLPLLAFLAAPFVAQAQQASKVPRIGFLGTGSLAETANRLEAFRHRLRDLGYVEGQNIAIEYRWADGKVERFPDFAVDLVGLKVDVIVATSTLGPAARGDQETRFLCDGRDTVGIGLVSSVARRART